MTPDGAGIRGKYINKMEQEPKIERDREQVAQDIKGSLSNLEETAKYLNGEKGTLTEEQKEAWTRNVGALAKEIRGYVQEL